MATVDELKGVLKETLENRGVLGQIRARVRAEVFGALDDQSEPRPSLSNENLLINELIREYLSFNKYKYTESVLLAVDRYFQVVQVEIRCTTNLIDLCPHKTGQPKDPMDRKFLIQELNISDEQGSSPSMPLLYGILAHFLHGSNSEGRRLKSLRDESLSQLHSRDTRLKRNTGGLPPVGDEEYDGRFDSSLVHEPEPVMVRGGR
ncbi:centrosomal protein 20-like isoform X1 [Montipora foliosa]|uniref:centrosomal protein 20-like isoform X1 n=1 Tax=Montipora foliosa TaxID=591990 RepID=UPI0035F15640